MQGGKTHKFHMSLSSWLKVGPTLEMNQSKLSLKKKDFILKVIKCDKINMSALRSINLHTSYVMCTFEIQILGFEHLQQTLML